MTAGYAELSRGLKEDTITGGERLIRRFLEFTNEYPWHTVAVHWQKASAGDWAAYAADVARRTRP
jgi:hypothetical protein